MSMIGRLALAQNMKRCLALGRGNASRCISTSKKNSDTTTIEAASSSACETETVVKEKNWLSYGFSKTDQEDDRNQLHALFFFGITITIVGGGVLLAYRPDDLLRDWTQREAFLEIRKREAAGLPLIDPNFIPLDQINLPTDEELGDTEIII